VVFFWIFDAFMEAIILMRFWHEDADTRAQRRCELLAALAEKNIHDMA